VSESLNAATILIAGHGGDDVEAYLSTSAHDGTRGGVVVIHHMPGYDRSTKEIVRRFAELGYDAVCPNLYFREAPGAAPDDAAATARAAGGVPDQRLIGDVAGAVDRLRALPHSNGRVGVIGYCSGGRQTVLAACNLDFDAAVDCYGAFVTEPAPEGFPIPITNLVNQLENLSCPLLGMFGNEDAHPGPEAVDELERRLLAAGKTFEPHRYDDAGHAFFSVDRPSYRVAAANDGWEQIEAFFHRYLGA
jgi:carboxymethylenebutenolidase